MCLYSCVHMQTLCARMSVCAHLFAYVHMTVSISYVCVGVCSLGGGGSHSVWVDEEAGEGAVLVCVPSVDLPPVQLHTHLIAHVQMQDHTVGGVVVILISILSDGTGSYLSPTGDTRIDN